MRAWQGPLNDTRRHKRTWAKTTDYPSLKVKNGSNTSLPYFCRETLSWRIIPYETLEFKLCSERLSCNRKMILRPVVIAQLSRTHCCWALGGRRRRQFVRRKEPLKANICLQNNVQGKCEKKTPSHRSRRSGGSCDTVPLYWASKVSSPFCRALSWETAWAEHIGSCYQAKMQCSKSRSFQHGRKTNE